MFMIKSRVFLKIKSVFVCTVLMLGFVSQHVFADVSMTSLFGDHMVLQQKQPIVVWGFAGKGEKVTVKIADLTGSATAGDNGKWRVKLGSLKAGGPYRLAVKGNNTIIIKDVMIGEVWICSGQSNMAFSLSGAYDSDLEIATANYPNIRLISVPQVGTQKPQDNFNGKWDVCSPSTVKNFSAVGYLFGKQLHQVLGVPVGLIDNAWGGSSAEAWVRLDLLQADKRYKDLLDRWKKTESIFDFDKIKAAYEKKIIRWKKAVKNAKANGKPQPRRPRFPRNPLTGQHRPANLYNGVLYPLIGYGIKGVIWYQGESNASRAYQYRFLFPLMIQNWRDDWKQGDFSFYWVQLADFRAEKKEPAESDWAELREAQTMTMSKLPNTGEAVIIDIGEGDNIHPRDKLDVSRRLARWALAHDYGLNIVYRSPIYKSKEIKGNKVVVTFDTFGDNLITFDVKQAVGFSIAGKDRKFVWANARIVGKNRVEVWSDQVKQPVAVRYAWADNPVCNLQNHHGLPVTPFRTDTWPGITVNNN